MMFVSLAVAAQPADIVNKELTKDSSVDEILDALDARGKGFKTFTADVKLAETTTDFGDSTTKTGKVLYEDRGNGDARIYVKFDTSQKNDEQPKKQRLEYKLEDGKLIERNYGKSSQTTQQVLRPGEKINLLKLGEGPFPLPIGQPKEEVHKQFGVTKVAPDKDDPNGTVHLQLIPAPNTRFARQFKSIDAWVDGNSHMPTRIKTRDRNETMDRTTDLSNVQINPKLTDQDFAMEKIDPSKWNVTEKAFQD
jgi:hypothetical protein